MPTEVTRQPLTSEQQKIVTFAQNSAHFLHIKQGKEQAAMLVKFDRHTAFKRFIRKEAQHDEELAEWLEIKIESGELTREEAKYIESAREEALKEHPPFTGLMFHPHGLSLEARELMSPEELKSEHAKRLSSLESEAKENRQRFNESFTRRLTDSLSPPLLEDLPEYLPEYLLDDAEEFDFNAAIESPPLEEQPEAVAFNPAIRLPSANLTATRPIPIQPLQRLSSPEVQYNQHQFFPDMDNESLDSLSLDGQSNDEDIPDCFAGCVIS
jgi:hypothetical protein